MLAHLLPEAGAVAGGAGELLDFDQRPFIPPVRRWWGTSSLDVSGFVFVPARCRQATRCRVHVALHGCRQGRTLVADAFARHAGYNEWAAAHDVIVLYPQVQPVEPTLFAWWRPINPRGCWDWWGYTGPDYATRNAVQIAAIAAMVRRLGEPR
jgi:poly(3-hydroxybutyrate) depolymerase